MTSRSEYRLLLRQDNADRRLSPIGYSVGLLSKARYDAYLEKQAAIDRERARLEATVIPPSEENNRLLSALGTATLQTGIRLADLLRRPELSYEALAEIDRERKPLDPAVILTVGIDIRYEGYLRREEAEVRRQERLEGMRLPEDIDYGAIRGLRIEAAQKLAAMRPMSVGQASRISGVNPADISVLLIYLGL